MVKRNLLRKQRQILDIEQLFQTTASVVVKHNQFSI